MEPIQESLRSEQSLPSLVMVRAEAGSRSTVNDLAGIAHDACNMLTALGLYCELLDEPGVLRPAHRHYVDELRMVAASGKKLVERLTGLRSSEYGMSLATRPVRMNSLPVADKVCDLAVELKANRNLLAALAGPAVTLEIIPNDCHLSVRLSGEDFTRILVNLVKNSCEAMPSGGRLEIALESVAPYADSAMTSRPSSVLITVNDTGIGIGGENISMIFEAGYTTKAHMKEEDGIWPSAHRGLGLAIVRSLVEEAGGTVSVESSVGKGTRFVIELPTVAQ
jgi:signal transduction histidine kinase